MEYEGWDLMVEFYTELPDGYKVQTNLGSAGGIIVITLVINYKYFMYIRLLWYNVFGNIIKKFQIMNNTIINLLISSKM